MNIALIAHDNLKPLMVDWSLRHQKALENHQLFGTSTTGTKIATATGLKIFLFKSGPLGGDQQIGAAIAEGKIDLVVFFWDPLQAHSHDVDVKALLRIAAVYNIPMACNPATADYLIKCL